MTDTATLPSDAPTEESSTASPAAPAAAGGGIIEHEARLVADAIAAALASLGFAPRGIDLRPGARLVGLLWVGE
jgi:hypothetical protein